MSLELPKQVYKPGSPDRIGWTPNRIALLAILVCITLLSGWHAFLLPGSIIKRNIAPPDMTGRENLRSQKKV